MPLFNPPAAAGLGGPIGFYGASPVTQSTGYTTGYALTSKALPSYTASVQSAVFSGGLLDLLQAAKLSDLNAMRVSLENLRVFAEGIAQQHNQMTADLKALGLIG